MISQPDILKRLEKSFGNEVGNLKEFSTPSGEGFRVSKVKEDEPSLSQSKQTRYRIASNIIIHSVPLLILIVN